MAAREVIERRSKWSIGNGEQVSIWKDRWIPSPNSFKVASPRPPHTDSELVASLIDKDRRGWDVSKVRNTFIPQEAQIILGIPVSPRLPQDSRIWAWTPSGNFTINSAYKVAQLLSSEADQMLEWGESSNNSGMQSVWKLIWSLNCPHKIKHFMWRACLNILPTKHQLRRRGIGQDGNCELCGCCEMTGHALWGCKLAGEVWGNTRLKLPFFEITPRDFIDVVWETKLKKPEIDWELFAITAWSL